ncbi:hypothetical protein ACIP3A_28135 [Streptomyces tricolor]|uniref:hypothetical protein n=1 Tax=Streptomyces TaxID=1883 RepID=UPI001AD82584|nr:hypothetical protein [Streptomyces sp. PBH53]
MWTVINAAASFPTHVFTAALLADRVAAVEAAITRAADPRHLLALADPHARHAARIQEEL